MNTQEFPTASPGARPSPGAETHERRNAPANSSALEPSELPAPEAGRTSFPGARPLCLLSLAAAIGLAPATLSAAEARFSRWVDAPHASGAYDNPGTETNVAWSISLHEPDATWLRVEFADCQLGARSFLRITSVSNQRSHRLNATSLAQWSNICGPLKGDTVWVELLVAPGDTGVRASVTRLMAGTRAEPGFTAATLCDGDSRVAIRDDRVGRMFTGGGCTAWLIQNGAVLSAGHCVDGGLGNFLSMNVPLSDADGTTNPSDPDDQFPMINGSEVWELIGTTGRDWGIFNIGPNNNTGENAHVGRGFIRITQAVPADGTTLRITGYGNDNTPAGTTGGNNSRHRTEQTSTGPFRGETTSGAQVTHNYRVDTEPANSGSPLIWRIGSVDFSIGIHTDGGCGDDGAGENAGTSFNQQNLATTVNTWPAATVRYLDTVSAIASETGSIFRPYRNFNNAYSGTPNGGTLILVAGSHPRTTAGNTGTWGSGQTKSITLRAPVGAVTIGN
jgi:V8-like Glu-specific endopeptidase